MKSKTNIDYLRELLTTDEQKEFLEGVEGDMGKSKGELKGAEAKVSDLEDEVDKLKDKIDSRDERINELEEQEFDGTAIDCGIGTIRYETEGSLDLQFLMEALAEAIKDHGAQQVLAHLREEYAV